jgi:CubicO group peptidase (beta-lactamase class C family)
VAVERSHDGRREAAATVEPLLQRIVESLRLAGLAVGVVRDGQVTYAGGCGVQSVDTGQPVTSRSVFHLASVSKPFVATAVLQLVEAGAIELDAPVRTYLPYFRLHDERSAAVTVRHLLGHTSGLPRQGEGDPWARPEADDGALGRTVRGLATAKLLFAPGERFAYSDYDTAVLGELVARVAGTPFEAALAARLFRPLGMAETTFLKDEVPPERLAAPHLLMPEPRVSPVYPYNRAWAPSACLHSSGADLCTWLLANLDRRRLGAHELLWRPHARVGDRDPYRDHGLGWFIGAHRGRRIVHHPGSDVGFGARLVLVPDQALGVAVLHNSYPAPVDPIADAVLDALLGHEPRLPRPPVILALADTLAAHGLDAAVARYHELKAADPETYDFEPMQYYHIANTWMGVFGQPGRAVEVYRLAVALHPEADAYWHVLAEAHLANGQHDRAIEAAERCLALKPEHPYATRLLERLRAGETAR